MLIPLISTNSSELQKRIERAMLSIMSRRPIRYLGDSVLRQTARRVRQIDGNVQSLIENMIESMYQAHGVGLAAPQIGVPLRVVVFGMPDEPAFAIINPEITKAEGTRLIMEGCLSVPGYSSPIERSESVTIRGLSATGERISITETNTLLAQAFEHETDHVNGILYVDYIDDHSSISYSPPRPENIEPESDDSF